MSFEIPLEPRAQELTVVLGAKAYNLRLTWVSSEDNPGWVLDIADSAGARVLSGVPLTPGVDLLGQFTYLGFGGKLFCGRDGDLQGKPLYADLGTTSHLWFEPDA